MDQNIIIQLRLWKKNKTIDVSVPCDLSVNELIIALNEAFHLNINSNDLSQCYLQTENPIALLKGNRSIEEYGLHNGSIINFTR
ncbi:EsaB/YukD family protein [Anaerosporobacter sp.]